MKALQFLTQIILKVHLRGRAGGGSALKRITFWGLTDQVGEIKKKRDLKISLRIASSLASRPALKQSKSLIKKIEFKILWKGEGCLLSHANKQSAVKSGQEEDARVCCGCSEYFSTTM